VLRTARDPTPPAGGPGGASMEEASGKC